jgi:hypothetical protein
MNELPNTCTKFNRESLIRWIPSIPSIQDDLFNPPQVRGDVAILNQSIFAVSGLRHEVVIHIDLRRGAFENCFAE